MAEDAQDLVFLASILVSLATKIGSRQEYAEIQQQTQNQITAIIMLHLQEAGLIMAMEVVFLGALFFVSRALILSKLKMLAPQQ